VSLNRKFGFIVELKKTNSLFELGHFLAVALVSFSFWFTSVLVFKLSADKFCSTFQLSFCRWSKFWLIVACDDLA